MMQKVLVSFSEKDLRAIDAAARKAGESRSAFLRRAALAELRRVMRPIDDPAVRRAYERLLRTAERLTPISTADALRARDRGRNQRAEFRRRSANIASDSATHTITAGGQLLTDG